VAIFDHVENSLTLALSDLGERILERRGGSRIALPVATRNPRWHMELPGGATRDPRRNDIGRTRRGSNCQKPRRCDRGDNAPTRHPSLPGENPLATGWRKGFNK
jgi:hypothetical protein